MAPVFYDMTGSHNPFVQGGMKAVVWTDSLQMLVILAGLIAVLIQGALETGGLANAWRIANEQGRVRIAE